MFGSRSFLVLGGSAADIVSLVKGGYEIADCQFSFEQGIDVRGKATTRVYCGIMRITLSQLPPKVITEWALNSKRYHDGAIIVLDAENMPLEKTLFEKAACIGFKIESSKSGEEYANTEITLQAKKIIVGNGIEFENEWTI
ncbi:MAG: type VI secretion system needle protein Hcp [Candidatus Azobacteroides sp.]|nr:type VI secretion system needle protein Hcp [Candidatus Azobacteroides sp.]